MTQSTPVPDHVEVHREPFIHLVDVAHDRAMIGWGAFFFVREQPDHRWEIVDDSDLPDVAGRSTCIGEEAESFGSATVQVYHGDELVTEVSTDSTWAWVEGLEPDTDYGYSVVVDGEEWAAGERWDWVPSSGGGYDLAPAGRSYDLSFRTFPDPEADVDRVRFVALGDYGVGVRSDSESTRRQRRIADVLDSLVADGDIRFAISLGDNIYLGEHGNVDDGSGGEDDDWYSSYYQPYRYAIARIPVFPTVGNHDTDDTEGSDDRAQLEDNFHISERFQDGSVRSSVNPGLFYDLRYGRNVELICLDTSLHSGDDDVHRLFQAPEHQEWLHSTFSSDGARWQIPFSHHPVFCGGPKHTNDEEMIEHFLPLFDKADVRLVLAGHEHNFQISEMDGRTYVVSGAGGQIREDAPDAEQFEEAGTTAWSPQAHLLVVEIDGDEARLTPVSGLLEDGSLHLMTALSPDNQLRYPPFVVRRD